MKKTIRIVAFICVMVLLLTACGGTETQQDQADEPAAADEAAWIDGSYEYLSYQYPAIMQEISFVPQYGTDGVAYGVSDEEGSFFGFTIEKMECEPGDYDELEPETFLQKYFPDHWDEYSIEELGDEDAGIEIARYNGNPVFCRGIEDLSSAQDDFKSAGYALEYLILDEGNNRSNVYVLTVYDGDGLCPGIDDYFSWTFCRSFTFDNESSKSEDLASEDNSVLDAEGSEYEPVELVLGDYPQYDVPPYYMTIVGAELFRHDGKEAVRIIYDVKNTTDNKWQAYEYFNLEATQDGETLNTTYGYEANEKDVGYDGTNPEVLIDMANYIYENEYSNNRRCMARDGYSVRTAEEYLCDWQGGPITLKITLPIFDYNLNFYAEDDPLIEELRENCEKEVTFDPADMPLKEKDKQWWTPVDDPAWTSGLPEEGDIFADDERYTGHVKLGDAEFTDVDGEKHMMLNLEYTNNGTEECSIFELLAIPVWKSGMADGIPHFWVMQDGASLLLVESDVTKHGQDQILQPGETADYVLEYIVRTDSPVEVEVNYPTYDGNLFAGKAAGKVYRQ